AGTKTSCSHRHSGRRRSAGRLPQPRPQRPPPAAARAVDAGLSDAVQAASRGSRIGARFAAPSAQTSRFGATNGKYRTRSIIFGSEMHRLRIFLSEPSTRGFLARGHVAIKELNVLEELEGALQLLPRIQRSSSEPTLNRSNFYYKPDDSDLIFAQSPMTPMTGLGGEQNFVYPSIY
uniref:DUF3398 domain-containing protein n=1 Tax=Macrostomum lignano TaxID=282301 RepID=A0A1I8JIV2_9PLAT